MEIQAIGKIIETLWPYLVSIVGGVGWVWAIVLKRKDNLIGKRQEAYSDYMKKIDEIMTALRTQPSDLLEESNKFIKSTITMVRNGNYNLDDNLIQFNAKILDFVKKPIEALSIIRQEIHQVQLVCSDKLLGKLKAMDTLVSDYMNETQKVLSIIAPNDSNKMIRDLQTLTQNERWTAFETLSKEILQLMRQEIMG